MMCPWCQFGHCDQPGQECDKPLTWCICPCNPDRPPRDRPPCTLNRPSDVPEQP